MNSVEVYRFKQMFLRFRPYWKWIIPSSTECLCKTDCWLNLVSILCCELSMEFYPCFYSILWATLVSILCCDISMETSTLVSILCCAIPMETFTLVSILCCAISMETPLFLFYAMSYLWRHLPLFLHFLFSMVISFSHLVSSNPSCSLITLTILLVSVLHSLLITSYLHSGR